MGQSIIAEVYSLNIVFVLLLFIFSLKANAENNPKWIFFMGLITGSGLIHHYPLFLASCTGLVLIFDWKKLNPKAISYSILGMALGLLSFLYLIIQMNNPDLEYNFGKVSNWEMLWKQFLRLGYRGVDEAGGDFTDKLKLSLSVIKLYFYDFKTFIILLPIGLFAIKKERRSLGVLLSFICSSFLLILLLGFTAEPHYEAVIKAYLVPNIVFLGLFLTSCLSFLVGQVKIKQTVLISASAVLLFINGALNFKDTTHFNDDFIYHWAKSWLESLEKNSVLILCGQEPYALYFVHKFLNIRPDITMYDRLSIMTKDNLYEPYLLFWKRKTKKQFENFRKKVEVGFIKNSTRPIYLTCAGKFNDHGFPLKQTSYFHRVLNHVPFQQTEESKVLSNELLDSAINSYPKTEYWLDTARNMVLFNGFSYYSQHNPSLIDDFLEKLSKHKNSKDQDFLHSLLEDTYKKNNFSIYQKLFDWNVRLNSLENLQPGTLGRYCTYRAGQKDYKGARPYCEQAHKNSKSCNIPVLNNLMFINFNMKKLRESRDWALKIIKCKPDHKGANSLLRSIK